MATLALKGLHYLSPIAVVIYFYSAKTIAACYLQKQTKHAVNLPRRYLSMSCTCAVVTTLIAQGLSFIVQENRTSGSASATPQHYVVYVLGSLFVYTALALDLVESKSPLWSAHWGAWIVALVTEIPCAILQSQAEPARHGDFAASRLALHGVRVLCFAVLVVSGLVYAIQDRLRRSHSATEESESLLGNGSTHSNSTADAPTDQSPGAYGSIVPSKNNKINTDNTDDEDEDDEFGYDSDCDETDEDKALRAEQRKRLKEAGSWFGYMRDFKIFIPILWPYRNRLVQGCILVVGLILVAERALNILVPAQLGVITEELTRNYGTGVMPWKAVGLWMLYYWLASQAGIELIKSFAELPIQQYAFKQLSVTAFRHVMALSMDFHNSKNSGELIRAIEQGQQLNGMLEFMCFTVGPTFIDLVISLVYVGTLFDIYFSLILLCIGTLYIYIGAKTTIMSIKPRRRLNTAWRGESQVQNEAINNWQTVSHFNRGEYECSHYTDTVDELNAAEWIYLVAYYCGGSAQSVTLILGRLITHSLAAYRVAQGRATVGNFVTLVSYWSTIESPLMSLSWSVRKVSSMLTDSERLLQLLKTKPTVVDDDDAVEIDIAEGEVVFEDVHFAYDPRKPTLQDVSFTAKPGQTVALVGETGGGKSTVLKLLYRYYDIQQGSIRIDGQDIRHVTLDSLRDSFGMVPQDPALFNDTILKNLKYARLDATDAEVEEACRAAQIHDKIMSFPDKYESKVGERGVKLSGGELQRIAIARALLRKPKLVLLDEATSAIDTETESHIQKALKQLTAHRTTFIIAHRLSTIQHADVILVVHGGSIVERGTHEELFRLNGKYVQLWSKQLSKEVQDVGERLKDGAGEESLIDVDSGDTTANSGDVDDS